MKKFALPVSTAVIVFALFAVAVSGSLFLAQRSFAKSDFENASKYGWMHDDLKQYEVFYSGDVIKLDKVIKRNPLNSDAWYIKAKWAQAEETYADANIFIRNALAIAPNDIKLYELKSRIEFDMGNFEATVSTINKLLNLLPDFWSGSQDGEDYEFRKRIFNKENSSFDVNFIYLSRAYFELDDIDNSLKYLSYAKDSYDKFYTYAVIYELIGESELAKEYEEKSFMFKQ